MAMLMAQLTGQDTLSAIDDDMEISSDVGRREPTDDDIDIDIDFGEPQLHAYHDDSMVDDDAQQDSYETFDTIRDDEMVDDEDGEDGYMQTEQSHPLEALGQDEELQDVNVDVDQEGDTEIIGNSFYEDHFDEQTVLDPTSQSALALQAGVESTAALADPPAGTVSTTINEENVWTQNLEQPRLDSAPSDFQVSTAMPAAEGSNENHPSNMSRLEEGIASPESQVEASSEEQRGLEPHDDVHDVDVRSTVQEPDRYLEDDLDDEELKSEDERTVTEDVQEEARRVQRLADEKLARTVSHELSSALDSSHHSVIVSFNGHDMDLFPTDENPKSTRNFLLDDPSLVSANLQDFLGSCRVALGTNLTDNEELEIGVAELGLALSEDSNQAALFSLADVLDVYIQLCQNDGIDNPLPLYLALATKHRFAARMTDLSSAVRDGLGWSHVTKSVDEAESDGFELEESKSHFSTVGWKGSLYYIRQPGGCGKSGEPRSELSATQGNTGTTTTAAEQAEERGVDLPGDEEFVGYLQHFPTQDESTGNDEEEEVDVAYDAAGDEHDDADPESGLPSPNRPIEEDPEAEEPEEPGEQEKNEDEGEEIVQDELFDYSGQEHEGEQDAEDAYTSSGSLTVQGDQVALENAQYLDQVSSLDGDAENASNEEAVGSSHEPDVDGGPAEAFEDGEDEIDFHLDDNEELADHNTLDEPPHPVFEDAGSEPRPDADSSATGPEENTDDVGVTDPKDSSDAPKTRAAASIQTNYDSSPRKHSRGASDADLSDSDDSSNGGKKARAS